jgi:hypothetical protein
MDVPSGDVEGLGGNGSPLCPERTAHPHPGLQFGVVVHLNPEPEAHGGIQIRRDRVDLAQDDAERAVAHVQVGMHLVPEGFTARPLGVQPEGDGAGSVDCLTADVRERALVGHG